MDSYKRTQQTYEEAADQLIKHWGATVRANHIDLAFKLRGVDKPVVLELGCGSGRDAVYILKKTNKYIGIDYSKKLINIATKNVPDGVFMLRDMVNAPFPNQCDIIIAFASLLHLDETKIKLVFEKAAKSLGLGGIFYISTKEGSGSVTKSDGFGIRTYYLYKASDLEKIAGKYFQVVYKNIERIREQDWVEVALRRTR